MNAPRSLTLAVLVLASTVGCGGSRAGDLCDGRDPEYCEGDIAVTCGGTASIHPGMTGISRTDCQSTGQACHAVERTARCVLPSLTRCDPSSEFCNAEKTGVVTCLNGFLAVGRDCHNGGTCSEFKGTSGTIASCSE